MFDNYKMRRNSKIQRAINNYEVVSIFCSDFEMCHEIQTRKNKNRL